MNANIDLPQELLYKEGNIWINGKNGQLRYNSKNDAASNWLNPLSTYFVGSSTKLKKGQPVAVGYESQLAVEASGQGDSAIVVVDPSVNQFSVGILLEPGIAGDNKKVHVQSHGQIEYDIANYGKEDYYLPPNDGNAFKWTYEDIGKPVYVSNKNKGELTIDLAEATYDGGTIICIGRIADAPLPSKEVLKKYQKILIEIQLSGDVRGVVDTTQISVDITDTQEISLEDNTSDYDKIIPVKIINGKGILVLNDAILKANDKNDIAGVFVAPSKNGKLSLEDYLGKTITITRLGIVSGNFGFDISSFGKTACIKDGDIDFEESSDSIEFKVGVGFGTNKFLVDCRYAKSIASAEMIGTIKPVFGENLTDAGYCLIDKSVHTVYGESIDWTPLLTYCYAKDIFVFSKNKNGPFTRVNEGNWELYGENTETGILSKTKPTYWKFRDLYYTIDDGKTCAAQIKYSKEGSPESQAYVWPEQCYQLDIPYKKVGTRGGTVESSDLRINITNLVQLGAYMDNNGQNIEAYDIIVQEKESGQIISPGFWQLPNGKFAGFEWQVVAESKNTYLYMITQPENVNNEDCLGVTWPIGTKAQKTIQLYVTVRRRPTQYNSIYLNQYPALNPWTPLVDSANNLVIQGDKIYIGGKVDINEDDGNASSGFTRELSSSIEFKHTDGENKAGVVYRLISGKDSDTKIFTQDYIIGDGEDEKKISWEYDLSGEVPVAKLNAQFQASFTAEDTTNEHGVEYDKSALRIFKVLYPSIFNESTSGKEKISIIKDRLSDFLENGYSFKIFDDTFNGEIKDSTNKLSVDKSDADVKQAINDGWSLRSKIDYQSFLGLLSRAATETEERLLKIERLLFGYDYFGAFSKEANIETELSYYVDDLGISRFLKFLNENGFISYNTEDYLDNLDAVAENNGFKSLLLNFLVDNYGNYGKKRASSSTRNFKTIEDAYDDFSKGNLKLNDILSESGGISHLAQLWINYKCQEVIKACSRITMNTRYDRPTNYEKTDDSYNFTLAKNIVFSKNCKGYNTDLPFEGEIYKGTPFSWPINIDPKWEERTGVTLEENFFGNTIFGVSDATGDYVVDNGNGEKYAVMNDEHDKFFSDGSPYEGQKATFAPQSLEGIIYDIIIKLSFMKAQFRYDGTFNPKRTHIASFINMTFGNIPTFKSLDDIQVFSNSSNTDSVYSAFEFDNDRLVTGYGLTIGQKDPGFKFSNQSIIDEWSDETVTKLYARWNKYAYSRKICSVNFTEPIQFYALYVFLILGNIEGGVYTNVLKGETTTYEKGEKKVVKYTQSDYEKDIAVYNDFIEGLKTGYIYYDVPNEDYKDIAVPMFKDGLDVDINTYLESLKHPVGLPTNGQTSDCHFSGQNPEKDSVDLISSIKLAHERDFDSADIDAEWVDSLFEGYEEATNVSNEFRKIIELIGHPDKINEQFIKNFFPEWKDYHDKKHYTVEAKADGVYQSSLSYRIARPVYLTSVNLFLNKINASCGKDLEKRKFFFGFLNGITGLSSEYEQSFPYVQRPIANNGLVWVDRNGKEHSCDFNDYIDKKVYSSSEKYNLLDTDTTHIEIVDDDTLERGWNYDIISMSDREDYDMSIFGDDAKIESLDPLTFIEKNVFSKNIRDSHILDKTLFEKINKFADMATIFKDVTQIGEVLEPETVGKPLSGFEFSDEFSYNFPTYTEKVPKEVEDEDGNKKIVYETVIRQTKVSQYLNNDVDWLDPTKGGFSEGYFFEKEFFSDGTDDSFTEDIDSTAASYKHDVLISDNIPKDVNSQGGDTSQKVETSIGKDSILMSTRETEQLHVTVDSCNSDKSSKQYVHYIKEKTENNNNKDNKKSLTVNVSAHTINQYGFTQNKEDVIKTVELEGDKTEYVTGITVGEQEFIKSGLGLSSKDFLEGINTSDKEYSATVDVSSGGTITLNNLQDAINKLWTAAKLAGSAPTISATFSPTANNKTVKITVKGSDLVSEGTKSAPSLTNNESAKPVVTPDKQKIELKTTTANVLLGTSNITTTPTTFNHTVSMGSSGFESWKETHANNTSTAEFTPFTHDHNITSEKSVVHSEGDFNHTYKEYYIKPLRRNLVSVKDAFIRSPVLKKSTRCAADRFETEFNEYLFNTQFIRPQIFKEMTFVNEFKFKDDSYINGQTLPIPDSKIEISSANIRQLIQLQHTITPSALNLDSAKSSNNIELKSFTRYSVVDTSSRAIKLSFKGKEYEITSFTVIVVDVEKTNNDPVRFNLELYGMVHDDSNGVHKYKLNEYKRNYFVIPNISVWPEKPRIFKPYLSEEISAPGYFIITTEGRGEMNVEISSPITEKALDFEAWKDFLLENMSLQYFNDDTLYANASEGEWVPEPGLAEPIIKTSLASLGEAYRKGEIDVTIGERSEITPPPEETGD